MKKRRLGRSRPPRNAPIRRLPLSKEKILAGALVATGILGAIALLFIGGSEPGEEPSIPQDRTSHLDKPAPKPLPSDSAMTASEPPAELSREVKESEADPPAAPQEKPQEGFEAQRAAKLAAAKAAAAGHVRRINAVALEKQQALRVLFPGAPDKPAAFRDALNANGALEETMDKAKDHPNATVHFLRGRYYASRGKDEKALKAFTKARELNADSYDALLDEVCTYLSRLQEGFRPFHGEARRFSGDRLELTYPFAPDASDLRDFSGNPKIAERGIAEFPPDRPILLVGGNELDPLHFQGALSVRMSVASAGRFSLLLFHHDQGGYELEFTPDRVALYRKGPGAGTRQKLGDAPLEAGNRSSRSIRLAAEAGRFTLYLDGREALFVQDPQVDPTRLPEGAFGIKTAGAPLRVAAPLAIQGRLERTNLNDRIGGPESLRRLLIDPELRRIQMHRERILAHKRPGRCDKDYSLSPDHPFFLNRIQAKDHHLWYPRIRDDIQRLYHGAHAACVSSEFDLEQDEETLTNAIDASEKGVPQLYYLRALIRLSKGDTEVGLADLDEALKHLEHFAEALVVQARYQGAIGNTAVVRLLLDRAIELRPDLASARTLRALLILETTRGRDLERAEKNLRLALELDRDDLEARLALGRLLFAREGVEKLGCTNPIPARHYRVVTDIREPAAMQYGALLDRAYETFLKKFAGQIRRGAPKPQVVVFSNPENYYIFWELLSTQRGEHTGGVYMQDLDTLAVFEGLNEIDTRHVLAHEAFHHFATLLLRPPLPHWLGEGMAEHMGSLVGSANRKGRILPGRLRDIQTTLLAGNPVDSFRKIMLATPRQFMGPNAALRYAQAWSMVRFFDEEHPALLKRYFFLLRDGKSPLQAYQASFASANRNLDLEREWKTYVLGLRVPDRRPRVEDSGKPKDPVPPPPPANPLRKQYLEKKEKAREAAAQFHYLLGRYHTRGEMHEWARDEYKRAIELDPDHAEARGELGHRNVDGAWIPDPKVASRKNKTIDPKRIQSIMKFVEQYRIPRARTIEQEWRTLEAWCREKGLETEAEEAAKEAERYAPKAD